MKKFENKWASNYDNLFLVQMYDAQNCKHDVTASQDRRQFL